MILVVKEAPINLLRPCFSIQTRRSGQRRQSSLVGGVRLRCSSGEAHGVPAACSRRRLLLAAGWTGALLCSTASAAPSEQQHESGASFRNDSLSTDIQPGRSETQPLPPSSQSAPQPGKPGSEQTAAGQASPGQPGKSGGESPVNGSPGKPGNGHAKSPPNAEDLTVNEAKKLLAEEEERRKMRRRKKGRIRELEEMRAELAEKELVLLEREQEVLERDQTVGTLREQLEIEKKLRTLLTKEKEKAEEEAALAMGMCGIGGGMLP